jgi:hypothetical protein
MVIGIICFILLGVLFGMIWFMTSNHTELDDIIRERVDYDVWLRRNSISEEQEKTIQRQKEDMEHQKRLKELKDEKSSIEKLLGK